MSATRYIISRCERRRLARDAAKALREYYRYGDVESYRLAALIAKQVVMLFELDTCEESDAKEAFNKYFEAHCYNEIQPIREGVEL